MFFGDRDEIIGAITAHHADETGFILHTFNFFLQYISSSR